MIIVKDITIAYGEKIVIGNMSHDFETGKIHVILGKSGSGKSTLIKAIAGLLPVQSGSIEGNESIAILFQEGNVFDWLTSLENASLPFLNDGFTKNEANDKARILLESVGLQDHIKAYPQKLSGGEKQRIALARALGSSASTILFDEATSALDFDTSIEMINLIMSFNKSIATTMLYVTHKIEEAVLIADTISILHNGSILTTINNTKPNFKSEEYWKALKFITELFDETIKV